MASISVFPGRSVGREAGPGSPPAPPAGRRSLPDQDPLLGALSLGSSREPISITADMLEFDYRQRVLTYKGHVTATQGDMKLQSSTLTVSLDDQAEGRVKEVVAEGDVHLEKGTRWATAGRAVFDQTRRTAVLSKDAVLHDGPNQVSGERVVVYLDEERSVVEGGNGRVKAVLFPPKGDTPATGTPTP